MEGWEDGHVGDLSLLGGPWGASKVGGGGEESKSTKMSGNTPSWGLQVLGGRSLRFCAVGTSLAPLECWPWPRVSASHVPLISVAGNLRLPPGSALQPPCPSPGSHRAGELAPAPGMSSHLGRN